MTSKYRLSYLCTLIIICLCMSVVFSGKVNAAVEDDDVIVDTPAEGVNPAVLKATIDLIVYRVDPLSVVRAARDDNVSIEILFALLDYIGLDLGEIGGILEEAGFDGDLVASILAPGAVDPGTVLDIDAILAMYRPDAAAGVEVISEQPDPVPASESS